MALSQGPHPPGCFSLAQRLGLQCGLGRASPKLVPLLTCEFVLFLLQEDLERPSWPSASIRPLGQPQDQ